MNTSHAIEYKIEGEEMQSVEITLDPQETVIGEAGALFYMEQPIEMKTMFGDGTEQNGIMGKILGAGKRLLTGESLFVTSFTHTGTGQGRVAFASPYPGKIIPFDLQKYGNKIICQRDAFLCAAKGSHIGVEFQKKLGTFFLGGEGFIMQKIEGDGLVFVHAGGHIIEKTLAAGEILRVDTGCVVAYTKDIDFDIEFVRDIKTALFGGEGINFAKMTGPGTVWLQTLPISRLAARILSLAPRGNVGGGQEQGNLLGGLGTISNIIGGNKF